MRVQQTETLQHVFTCACSIVCDVSGRSHLGRVSIESSTLSAEGVKAPWCASEEHSAVELCNGGMLSKTYLNCMSDNVDATSG